MTQRTAPARHRSRWFKRHAGRLRPFFAGAGSLLWLSGCAASWPSPERPAPPPPPPRGVALLSTLGDESGLRVTAVEGLRAAPPLRAGSAPADGPVDAPAAIDARMGFWLVPGQHVIRVQYVRNIESGISLAQTDLPITVRAGRTYILRPLVGSDFGKVGFTLIDHGPAFPVRCLPWSISDRRIPDARGERAPYGRADIEACRQRALS